MSKNKDQGTRWETAVKAMLRTWLQVPVTRLVEGGAYDRGDLALAVGELDLVVECRDRETMQVHTALDKARRKAPDSIVFVAWKRKKRQPGNQVRTQVGPPVAILALEDLMYLLALVKGKGQT